MTDLTDFLQLCSTEITRRASLAPDQPQLAIGARCFEAALAASSPRQAAPSIVPVTSWLSHLPPSPIGDALIAANPQIPWAPSQRVDDSGTGVALAPLNQVLDLGDFQCGLMLLGPGHAYPEHSHPPHEIYLPISGGGQWRHGGSTRYRSLAADELVYNNPGDTHSAVASDQPLVALYILWT